MLEVFCSSLVVGSMDVWLKKPICITTLNPIMLMKLTHMYNYIKSYYVNEINPYV
jgi:hypothetical protein